MINRDYETIPEPIEWCVWTGHNIDEVLQLGGHGQWSFKVGYPHLTLYGWNDEIIAHKDECVVYHIISGVLKGYSQDKFAAMFRTVSSNYPSVFRG